jgi:hypothetical protein
MRRGGYVIHSSCGAAHSRLLADAGGAGDIPAARDLARAEFATLRLLKIAVRVQETISRIRLAFASWCPDADFFRRLASALAPQPQAASP